MIVITTKPAAPAQTPSDIDLALSRTLRQALERQPWSADAPAQLFVTDGVVTVEGFVADEAFAAALCAAARDVAGANNVRDALIRVDAVAGCVLAMT